MCRSVSLKNARSASWIEISRVRQGGAQQRTGVSGHFFDQQIAASRAEPHGRLARLLNATFSTSG